MMYIKFLYKDIMKNKVLWIITTFMLTMLAFVLSFGLNSMKNVFDQGIFQRIRVSRQNLDFNQGDWNKLISILKDKQFSSLYIDNTSDCKVIIVGDEYFSNSVSNIEEYFSKNRLISVMSYDNFDGCIIEKGDLNNVKSIDKATFENVLTNITSNDTRLEKELKNVSFDSVSIRLENINNDSYQINSFILSSILFCIIIFQVMMYYTIYQYQAYKQSIEYKIHQFYGSNFMHILIRTGLYFLSIIVPSLIIINTVKIPLSTTILFTSITIIWLFSFSQIIKQFKKRSNIV